MSEGTHAKAAPSGADGWMNCKQWKSGSSSVYSRDGSCKHLVSALALSEGKEADDYVGEIYLIDGHEIEFTENMVEPVQTYIDEINEIRKGHTLVLEGKISISALTGEPGAEGTADAVIIPDNGTCLPVSDAKFGYRPVEVKQNKQLMIYALAVLERYGMTGDYESVMLRIHQPALNKTSEWEVSVDELMEFKKLVKIKAAEYLDPNKPLDYNPSDDACEWCGDLATCPARRQMIVADTAADFNDLTQQELPVYDDPEFLSKAMQKVGIIEAWTKAVRAKTEANLLIGIEVPGYKIVEGKKGRRQWVDKDDAEETLKRMRLKSDEMYDKKVKSPTKIEKILSDNPLKWDRLQELIEQKKGKPSVAPVSDPRPAMLLDPSQDFEALT